MAIVVKNTNYNGEVLERILTVATTGNELVDKGLIMVIPGVEKKISVPRLKTGKMLQKRKEDPQKSDAQGDFNYSEQTLEPHDFMAFTVFNPRAFEQIWRKWQPKGNLVFAELPPEAQNALLEALSKQVQFELGNLFVNGEYVSGGTDDQLMDGILTQAAKASDVIVVNPEGPTSMIDRLYAVRNAIPKAMRENPNSYCAKFGKKNFIHSSGRASSHARCFCISACDMVRSTGVARAMLSLNFSQFCSAIRSQSLPSPQYHQPHYGLIC